MSHNAPVESIAVFLEEHGTDVIILATDLQKCRIQWLNGSIATSIARNSREMTLFIPKGIEVFVSLDDGSISQKTF